MTTLVHTASPIHDRGVGELIASAFNFFSRSVFAAREADRLLHLSETALERRGLRRDQIGQEVYRIAYGTV